MNIYSLPQGLTIQMTISGSILCCCCTAFKLPHMYTGQFNLFQVCYYFTVSEGLSKICYSLSSSQSNSAFLSCSVFFSWDSCPPLCSIFLSCSIPLSHSCLTLCSVLLCSPLCSSCRIALIPVSSLFNLSPNLLFTPSIQLSRSFIWLLTSESPASLVKTVEA